MHLLKRLFQRPRQASDETPLVGGRPPRLPEGVRVYAIGDIHGRIDLLRDLEARILADRAAQPTRCNDLLVYLGDYVDRGLDSNRVLDHLAADPPDGFGRVLLLGNHDLWLRLFLAGEPVGDSWLRYGGDATLLSYGVPLAFDQPEQARLAVAREALAAKVPAAHRRMLDSLELMLPLGDYLFCHAGIRPGVPLDRQEEHDVIWIREPFLSWDGDCGKVIVHGHTIEDQPVIRRNRIGIDTGACFNGNLTCLVLEGATRRFLSTTDD